MTEHAPISTIVPKSSAHLGNSTLSAVHPSAASPLHNSLHRLVSTQPARPRHSNPHSACGSAIPSLSPVSSLGGFRTPAAELAAPALKRPASETLHNSGVRADIPGPPLWDSCIAARKLYSITSSARTSSEGGTVSPSALAVFMLITSSNLVGCSTGRSAGLVPLRILSTKVAARRNKSG